MLSGVMNVRAVFDFTDAEYFSFVAAGLCTFYNRVCPGDIIVTELCWLAFGHVKLSMPESCQ